MKINSICLLTSLIIFFSVYNQVFGQKKFCNTFDSTLINLKIIDSGIWKVGKPEKTTFKDSFSGNKSVVTGLKSNYKDNSNGSFEILIKENGGLPNHLGVYFPIEITLKHRFIIANNDSGKIEVSIDGRKNWLNVNDCVLDYLSGMHYHYFENSKDTSKKKLDITGDSKGWVHSKFTLNMKKLTKKFNKTPDSAIVRFRFVSDATSNDEGWQIDDLCISFRTGTSVNEIEKNSLVKLFPNPARDFIVVESNNIYAGKLELYNIKGQIILSERFTKPHDRISISNYPKGIYFYQIKTEKRIIDSGKVVLN